VRRSRRLVAWARMHPVATVFVIALAARVVASVILERAGLIHDVAPDSALYLQLARDLASGAHEHWDSAHRLYGDDWAVYLVPVSALFRVFGTHTFLAQLVTAAFAAVSAAVMTRVALEVLPRAWAFGVGGVVALFPSLIVWSSVPLRDSAVWAFVACIALLVVLASKAQTNVRLAFVGLGLGAAMFFAGELRGQAVCIAAFAIMIQAVFGNAQRRLAVIGMSVGLAVAVPMLVGLGPLGIEYLQNRDLGEIRVANATGAESALDVESSGGIAHLPEGLKVVLTEPLPWTSLRGETVVLGHVESPLWWFLVLASLTAVPVLWRRRQVLGFPALYAGGVVVVLALGEGNFGTLYRHRGELVAPFALLGGVGLKALFDRRHARRSVVAAV
jgi:hypothetical protein